MLSFKAETITPKQAEEMLANTAASFVNRGATGSFIKRYAQDMRAGNWHSDTGETIKIDTKGRVIDGQHRLQAIQLSEKPQRIWVCRGIETEMFQFIDQGKTRDLKDIMVIEQWPDPAVLNVTAKMLWRYEKTMEMRGTGNPYAHAGAFNESDGAIFDWVTSHQPDIKSTWESYKGLINKAYKGCQGAVPVSLLYYIFFQWNQNDSKLTLDLFGYLGDPLAHPAPHIAAGWAVGYCQKLRQAQQETGVGGTTGRHADAKESMLSAFNLAWEIMHDRESIKTWTGFKRRIKSDGGFGVPN